MLIFIKWYRNERNIGQKLKIAMSKKVKDYGIVIQKILMVKVKTHNWKLYLRYIYTYK